MKSLISKRHVTLLTFLLVFCLAISFGAGKAISAQKGDVVIAYGGAAFNTVGGDTLKQTGAPPFSSRTVFDPLVHVTQDRVIVPGIATKWEVSAGWKYMDYFIRTDVKFSDGTPLTMDDIIYSLNKYRDEPKFVFGAMWRRTIKNFEVISPTHLRVHFNTADQGFIGRLWWSTGIMPKAYREKVGDKGFADKPMGSGPFTWDSYKQDRWIKVKARAEHFRQAPFVKSVKVVFVPEHSTRLAMLKTGEAHIVDSLLPAHVKQVEKASNTRVMWNKFVSGGILFYGDLLDMKTPSPFHDIRVRRAVSLAINRKAITEKVLFGASEPWGDVLAPITLGYDPSLKPTPYDPEKAKRLLKEAGYPNGFETTITVQTTDIIAEALAASLLSVGIKAKVVKMEPGAYYGNFFPRKLRGIIPYVGWYDPEIQAPADLMDFYLKGMPHAYATSDEIDAAIKEGMYSENDDQLFASGRKISKIIRESEYTTFLWATHSALGLSDKILEWKPTVGGIPPIEYETIKMK